MNKKAQLFQEYLQEKNINCFQVQEVPEDALNTVVFRSSIEVEGQQLPTLVITDSSIYTMIRVRVANPPTILKRPCTSQRRCSSSAISPQP